MCRRLELLKRQHIFVRYSYQMLWQLWLRWNEWKRWEKYDKNDKRKHKMSKQIRTNFGWLHGCVLKCVCHLCCTILIFSQFYVGMYNFVVYKCDRREAFSKLNKQFENRVLKMSNPKFMSIFVFNSKKFQNVKIWYV